MSLAFTAGGTDRVVVAAHASHNSATKWTAWCWIYPTSAAINNRVWQKQNAGASGRWTFRRSVATTGRMDLDIFRATTFSHQETDDFILSQWQFAIVTYDEAAVQGARIYRGTLVKEVNECTYVGSNTNGSGATGTVDGEFTIGNRSAADRGFGGWVGNFGFLPRVLTLREMRELRDRPWPIAGTAICHEYLSTALTLDRAGNGNNGTVTGAVLAPHVFHRPMFTPDEAFLFAPAAAAFNAAWNIAANTLIHPGAVTA